MDARDTSTLFDHLPIGAYRTSLDGRVLRGNPALVRLNGCHSEDELLEAVNDIATQWYVEPGRRAQFRALIERDGQVQDFESEVRRIRTGERVWVRETAFVLRDDEGRAVGYEGTVEDITEVRRARLALESSERRLRALIDGAQVLIMVCDRAGRASYVSPAVEAMLGRDATATLGLDLFDLLHPDDVAPIREQMAAIADGREVQGESLMRVRRADGRWRTFSVLGRSCLDDPALRGIVLNCRDVTRRERAIAAERAATRRLAGAFAASPDAMLISRLADGTYLEVNDRAVELLGYTRDALVGHSSLELRIWFPASRRDDFVSQLVQQRQVRDFEAGYRRRDGGTGVVSISAEAIDVDGVECALIVMHDITQRLRDERERAMLLHAAEAARRGSETARELLDHVFERINDGVVALDADWRYTYVNARAARMLQRRSPRDLIGKHIWTEYPEGVGQPFHRAYLEAARTQQPAVIEEHYAPWGLWFENRIYPSDDGLTIYFTEITQRKQAEQALRRQVERLQRAEAIAQLGSWELDLAGGQVWWSEQMRVLAGSRPGEAPATDLRHLHPDDRAQALQAMSTATAQGGSHSVVVRSNPKRGPLRWFVASGQRECDAQGRPVTLSGTLLDVTALRNAELALRELNQQLEQRVAERTAQLAASERRHRFIFESVPVAILEQDWSRTIALLEPLRDQMGGDPAAWLAERPELVAQCRRATKVVRMNRAAAELSGNDGAGPPDADLAQVFERYGSTEGFVDELAALLLGQRHYRANRSLPQPDGSRKELLATVAFPGGNEPAGSVLVSLADVTEIRHLSAALDASLRRVRRVNRELETFTYSVSHDLKAPLRAMDGYSQLLLRDHASSLDDEGRLFLDNIRSAARQMGQLIDDLLAYSRLERRTQELTAVALAPIVEQVLAGFGDDLARLGIVPEVELGQARVRADVHGLTLALRNLVDNALKFSAQVARPTLAISARLAGSNVVLSVRDHGIGFDMKFHDRIFEIFQRLLRSEDYPGTGVGLAIVGKAVERMGGRVWADSAPGQGASFHIELARA